jgi:peptidylprolyl isomerase
MMRYLFLIILAAALLAAGCGGGSEATPTPEPTATPAATAQPGDVVENGDTVGVYYRGTLDDGTEFDSNVGGDPLQFPVGEGKVIEGFDKAVLGMAVGDRKTVTIPADEAYGPYREDQVLEIDREQFPPAIEVGQDVPVTNQQGQMLVARIVEITDTTVKVHLNHPLAGEDLTFEIELAELTKAEPGEGE